MIIQEATYDSTTLPKLGCRGRGEEEKGGGGGIGGEPLSVVSITFVSPDVFVLLVCLFVRAGDGTFSIDR